MGDQPSCSIEANCVRAFLTLPTCWLIAPFAIVTTTDNYNKINYVLQLVEYRCQPKTTRRFIACDASLVSQCLAVVFLSMYVCVSVCMDTCAWAGDAKGLFKRKSTQKYSLILASHCVRRLCRHCNYFFAHNCITCSLYTRAKPFANGCINFVHPEIVDGIFGVTIIVF